MWVLALVPPRSPHYQRVPSLVSGGVVRDPALYVCVCVCVCVCKMALGMADLLCFCCCSSYYCCSCCCCCYLLLLLLLPIAAAGEIALLDRRHLRSASVKATTFCDMQTLGKDDFDEFIAAFPFFRKSIIYVAESR